MKIEPSYKKGALVCHKASAKQAVIKKVLLVSKCTADKKHKENCEETHLKEQKVYPPCDTCEHYTAVRFKGYQLSIDFGLYCDCEEHEIEAVMVRS